ncbi:DNA-directed RNA polymerase subunit omega [Oceanivirga miroungae]|uniref:DNA-directed RNA polymerase n=1 Tax=Oceanivirga miroungae TaxID=1130046 RepID=A0A6I8MAZ9_9FUSO|nr:DNA-directed RNA polymerase subunit omega [Oceanivirga miroungae]VWL85428.1 hypothetical protein OMES3154_00713 [Oceanivirga miroungae]
MKKNNKNITVDELLEVFPNKYELAIACGKIARSEYLEGEEKYVVMYKVFKKIIDKEVIIKEL